jgi:hypothetical protein
MTHRSHPANGSARRIGCLGDDLGVIARMVWRTLTPRDVVVWTNRDAQIFVDFADAAPPLPSSEIIGTYRLNARRDDIEADLEQTRRDRITADILD